jgi:hypothetical protein
MFCAENSLFSIIMRKTNLKYFWCIPVITLFLWATSCKKEEIIAKTEENIVVYTTDTIVVLGNTPPADTGVSALTVDNFINKTYITLIGRKPNDIELATANTLVSPSQFSVNHRKLFIDHVLGHTTEYYTKLFSEQSIQLLQNTDSNDINNNIATYQFILSNVAMQEYWVFAQYQLDRLLALKNTYYEFLQGQKTLQEVHRALIDNVFYDDINMGSSNFVTSSFLHFLNRYPTTDELAQSILMVDGFSAVLFYNTGHDKADYIDIFFTSDSYYEGQVQDVFYSYLGRNPSVQELSANTTVYKSTGNYAALLKEVLSTKEFAGITS